MSKPKTRHSYQAYMKLIGIRKDEPRTREQTIVREAASHRQAKKAFREEFPDYEILNVVPYMHHYG